MISAAVDPLLSLPQYVEDHRVGLIEVPLRILLIVIVCVALRAILRRVIDRAVTPRHGETPRILRPFKERAEQLAWLESTGLLSERRNQRAQTIGSVLKSFVSATILVIGSMLVLSELGVNLAPFIAGTSIIGVALGFGAQNLIKDFLSGMFMMLEDQYGVGDTIDFEKASGTVEGVGLRTTRLRDINGTVWYVRNGEVVRVGNKSQGFAQVVLDVPIAAGANLQLASSAMLAVAQDMREDSEWASVYLADPEMQGVEKITREETVLRLVAKVRPGEQWRTAGELRRRIRERLDTLEIPAGDSAN
jgi:small conductance mechanosensitive channel